MNTEETTARLMEPFPAECIKTRPGRNGMVLSYLEGHTVLRRLIEATGNSFSYRILDMTQTGDVLMATVELEIEGMGVRQQIGVQRIMPNSGEDLAKGCLTDGLKRCCMLFGIGLELYDSEPQYDQGQGDSEGYNPNRNGYARGNGGSGERTSRPNFRPIKQTA